MSPSIVDIQTVSNSQTQKSKTVEGKLWGTMQKLADTEANIHLFSTLKLMGLATNDVKSFVEKQVIHKRTHRHADNKLKKCAM